VGWTCQPQFNRRRRPWALTDRRTDGRTDKRTATLWLRANVQPTIHHFRPATLLVVVLSDTPAWPPLAPPPGRPWNIRHLKGLLGLRGMHAEELFPHSAPIRKCCVMIHYLRLGGFVLSVSVGFRLLTGLIKNYWRNLYAHDLFCGHGHSG